MYVCALESKLRVCVVWCVPARFQARQCHNAAILSVCLEHALGVRLLGKRQHITGVAVGRVDPTYRAALECVRYHDDKNLQGGDGGFVLTVPDDPQKYPGRRGKTWLTRVARLRDQNKVAVRYSKTHIEETEVKFSCSEIVYYSWLHLGTISYYVKMVIRRSYNKIVFTLRHSLLASV